MNERIKNLILTAGWKNAYSDSKDGFEVVFEDEEHNLACIEKFAELIVRECAKIVEASTWNLPHGYKAVDQAKLVKQHFGVE